MELLLFLVERSYAPKKLAHKTEGIGEKKNNIVYEIINYIDNNIFAIQRLTDISQYTGYSYAYLSQVFSNAMGISLNVYYQKARFKRAVELLECGVGTTQVAELLGFDSVYSFSRAFKNHFGLSPTHYLKTISKNEPLSKNQK